MVARSRKELLADAASQLNVTSEINSDSIPAMDDEDVQRLRMSVTRLLEEEVEANEDLRPYLDELNAERR